MIFLFKCDFFIPGKKFVEESDKFLGSALRRQRGETADIGKQYTEIPVGLKNIPETDEG